jgi:hypothetical protein
MSTQATLPPETPAEARAGAVLCSSAVLGSPAYIVAPSCQKECKPKHWFQFELWWALVEDYKT